MSERAIIRTYRIDDEVTGYDIVIPPGWQEEGDLLHCDCPMVIHMAGYAGKLAHWLVEAWNSREALAESVKLQSHYASLLNMHDGGTRYTFDSPEAWVKRLEEVKRQIEKEQP